MKHLQTRMHRAVFLIISLALAAAATGTAYRPATNGYQPRPGDVALIWKMACRPGQVEAAGTLFRQQVLPRLKREKGLLQTFIMAEPGENILLVLAFCRTNRPGKDAAELVTPEFAQLDHLRLRPVEPSSFQMVLSNDEAGYTPRVGDSVALATRTFTPENFPQALELYKTIIYPHIAADPVVCDNLLTADDRSRTIICWTLYRGDPEASPGLAPKIAELERLRQGSAAHVDFRIISILNE